MYVKNNLNILFNFFYKKINKKLLLLPKKDENLYFTY
jgi:hypothetical protein